MLLVKTASRDIYYSTYTTIFKKRKKSANKKDYIPHLTQKRDIFGTNLISLKPRPNHRNYVSFGVVYIVFIWNFGSNND